MAARPSCKAVVKEGNNAGAQIWPPGCIVRRRVDANDRVTQHIDRRGNTKKTVTVNHHEYGVNLYHGHGAAAAHPINAIWDTGAAFTTIDSNTAQLWGLLTPAQMGAQGIIYGQAVNYQARQNIRVADNRVLNCWRWNNVRLTVEIVDPGNQNQLIRYPIRTYVVYHPNLTRLLGTPALRQLRNQGLKLKWAV